MRLLKKTKRHRHFFNNVIIKLGFYNWTIVFVSDSSEGYCNKRNKRISVGLDSKNIKQLILHEIAHINTCRFCNQKHNPAFWKTFELLMQKFLPGEKICESQGVHKSFTSNGFYRLCYQS